MADATAGAPPQPSSTANLEALIARVEGRLDGVEKRLNIVVVLMGALLVALVTSNGMLWNAIATSERELRQELVQLERRIDDRMSAMEQRLNDRIDRLDRELNDRIDRLDAELSGRIDEVEHRLRLLEIAFTRAGIEVPLGDDEAPTEPEPEQRTETDGSPTDPLEPGAGPDLPAE